VEKEVRRVLKSGGHFAIIGACYLCTEKIVKNPMGMSRIERRQSREKMDIDDLILEIEPINRSDGIHFKI